MVFEGHVHIRDTGLPSSIYCNVFVIKQRGLLAERDEGDEGNEGYMVWDLGGERVKELEKQQGEDGEGEEQDKERVMRGMM